MSDNIIRFTNGDDGVFAHVVAPSGKHYGINVEHLACDADDEWNLVGKFFRAVVDKVNAENGPFSSDDAAQMPAQGDCPKCAEKISEVMGWAAAHRELQRQNNELRLQLLYSQVPAQAPEGWKFAPVNQTVEMREAGNAALDAILKDPTRGLADRAYYVFDAMLAAAPTPPNHIHDVCHECVGNGSGGLHEDDCSMQASDDAKDAALNLARDALSIYADEWNKHWERGMPILEPIGDEAIAAIDALKGGE